MNPKSNYQFLPFFVLLKDHFLIKLKHKNQNIKNYFKILKKGSLKNFCLSAAEDRMVSEAQSYSEVDPYIPCRLLVHTHTHINRTVNKVSFRFYWNSSNSFFLLSLLSSDLSLRRSTALIFGCTSNLLVYLAAHLFISSLIFYFEDEFYQVISHMPRYITIKRRVFEWSLLSDMEDRRSAP